MSGVHIEPSLWLKNITQAVSMMIEEEKNKGALVQGIIMTENIYDKLTKAFGYPPVDWLGYVIEVIENDIDDEDAEELIMIKGSLLN